MSLAIDYRPSDLDSMYGNEAIIATLRRMLKDKESFPHTLLLHGQSGCGKTTLARIIANMLDCHPDDVMEYNTAKFRGIDTVRTITDNCIYPSMLSENGIKVYILDEFHRVTGIAMDAFLKPLEDTPKHVYFILCTTDPQKVAKAIRTRSSEFQLKPLKDDEMEGLLTGIAESEGKKLKPAIIETIVDYSGGLPRQAVQKLQQVLAAPPKKRLIIAKQAIAEKEEGYALCKALLSKRSSWGEIAKILKGLNKQEIETVRYNVMGYASAILLRGKDDENAGRVLENFSEPFYDSGFNGLVLASYLSFKV